MSMSFFAVCTPGLEMLTADELQKAGILKPDPQGVGAKMNSMDKGGVAFEGSLAELYLANLILRTANRILLRVADFRTIGFSELRKKAARISWEQYLKKGQAINLRVSCHKSRLYHSAAVAERVAGAIGDRLGVQPPVIAAKEEDEEQHNVQLILVRLLHDQCTISIDSSGELLHRRGYRQAVAKAPLRETLAAGMLMASGWDRRSPLLDPFCGSGTIPIEAAMLASNIPPGLNRSFAFMNWRDFETGLWKSIRENALAQIKPACPGIMASDRDAGAIEMAKSNAQRAGVLDQIEFTCQAVSAIQPDNKGWVVTNPPYGLRVSSNKDLRNLYAQFGNVLKEKCPGWQAGILCSDAHLLRQIELSFNFRLSTVNGGIPVRMGVASIP